MATSAEVEAFRRAQQAVSAAARGNLASFWAGLNQWEVNEVRDGLESFLPALVDQYGDASAALAADWFEGLTGADAVFGDPAVEAAVNARMRWSLGDILKGDPAQSLATLQGVLDELVKQPGRDTIAASAHAAGIRYARVPSGSETCAFCLMLASRGAVYVSNPTYVTGVSLGGRDYQRMRNTGESRESILVGRKGRTTKRSLGEKYHGDCDCVATPIRDESDLPEGYDPDALYDQYNRARTDAHSGSEKKILAEMREQQGIH